MKTEIVIARPRREVAAYAGNPVNAPEWYENIESVEMESPTRATFKARFLGRTLVYTYEIRENVPGERLVMSTEQGPFPMETTYTWEAVPGGTLMKLHNRGAPSGFSKVAAPMMSRAMRSAMTKDLERLSRRLAER